MHAAEEDYEFIAFLDVVIYERARALYLSLNEVGVMLTRFRRTFGYCSFEKGNWYGLDGIVEDLAMKLFVDRSVSNCSSHQSRFPPRTSGCL